jgi:nitric oxide reductase activation protein
MGSRLSGCALSAVIVILLLLWTPGSLSAQSGTQRGEPSPVGDQGVPVPKDVADKMEKERLRERYQNLKRDSEKLLEMATELKQYVDKSGENVMSLDVIRKCDEIEKLSKSVRSKMKGN